MHQPPSLVAAETATYVVYTLIALLAVLGVAMVLLTVWLVKTTRPEHESLSALAVMGTRQFRREGTMARERRLAPLHQPGGDGAMADGEGDRGPASDPPDDDEAQEPPDPDATGAIPVLDPFAEHRVDGESDPATEPDDRPGG